MTKATAKPYTPPPGNYQGAELRPVQGIPAARMNDRLHYLDGRVLPFPTSSLDPAA